MKSKLLPFLAFALILTASIAFIHAADDKDKKSEPKVISVCPISGDDAEIKEERFRTVGNYKVYFCCGRCRVKFDDLSDTEKLEKVKKAEATQDGKK